MPRIRQSAIAHRYRVARRPLLNAARTARKSVPVPLTVQSVAHEYDSGELDKFEFFFGPDIESYGERDLQDPNDGVASPHANAESSRGTPATPQPPEPLNAIKSYVLALYEYMEEKGIDQNIPAMPPAVAQTLCLAAPLPVASVIRRDIDIMYDKLFVDLMDTARTGVRVIDVSRAMKEFLPRIYELSKGPEIESAVEALQLVMRVVNYSVDATDGPELSHEPRFLPSLEPADLLAKHCCRRIFKARRLENWSRHAEMIAENAEIANAFTRNYSNLGLTAAYLDRVMAVASFPS